MSSLREHIFISTVKIFFAIHCLSDWSYWRPTNPHLLSKGIHHWPHWSSLPTFIWQIHLSSMLKPTCSGIAWKICRRYERCYSFYCDFDMTKSKGKRNSLNWLDKIINNHDHHKVIYLWEWWEWLMLIDFIFVVKQIWTTSKQITVNARCTNYPLTYSFTHNSAVM